MKPFKRNSGQQIFVVCNLLLLYLWFMMLFMIFIIKREDIKEYLSIIFPIIISSFLFFGFIYLIVYLISKKFSKVNFICYDKYFIVQDKQVYYDNVSELKYKLINDTRGPRGLPFAPASLDIKLNDNCFFLNKVSLYSYFYLKKRCKKAKSRIKGLWVIILVVPIVIILIALFVIMVGQSNQV